MFSKEELESFTLKQLRLIDIKEVEDEALVQELINKKLAAQGNFDAANVKRDDFGDITTPEQEAEAQKIIDARVAAVKNKRESSKNPATTEIVSEEVSSPGGETKQPVNEAAGANVPMMDIELTEEDLNENPELREQGLKAGDVVQIPEAEQKEVEILSEKELDKKTRPQLVEYADSLGLELDQTLKKKDMVKAILKLKK